METYLVSARKYRPATFDTVVGQQALTTTLKNAIATGRLAHSYLFCGSRGVGKTSCARIMAKTINCEHRTPDGEACNECDSCRAFNAGTSLNIIELDAASNNSVDDIRQLTDQVQIPPSSGRYRVFIIDEVHMLSSAAFNAFLKTLEEPPSYVIFILATTEKHKILPTILSRCQIYDFNRITIQDIINHLSYVASKEGLTAEPAALNVIAQKADGAMRDALSIFDQVAASTRGNITYQATLDNLNVLDYEFYNRLLDTFIAGDILSAWLIYKEIRDLGFDSKPFINGLGAYFRDLMVARDPRTLVLLDAGDEAKREMAARSAKCSPEFLYKAMDLCNQADLNFRVASNKQFLTELMLAKICQLQSPAPDNGDNGTGLKKINVAPRPAATAPAAPAPQTPTPAPAPAQPQAPVQAQAPAPAQAPRPKPATPPSAPASQVRSARGPALSLRNLHNRQEDTAGPAPAAEAPRRDSPFIEADLQKAWEEFAAAHPTQHILVNTMRAARPVRRTDGSTYLVTVENEHQLTLLKETMPSLLQSLRDALSNDSVAFDIEVNQGESAPATWNQREVLAHMTEAHPQMSKFISDLGLTL